MIPRLRFHLHLRRHLRPGAIALACASAACLSPAHAQTMKPGLWQNTSKTTSQNPQIAQAMAEMQKQMASMTPEQRKAMGKLAGQSGAPPFEMNADGSVSMKLCVTQKMIDDAGGAFLGPQDGNCTHKKGPLAGGTQSFSFTCNKPPSSGQGKVAFQGGTSYASSMSITSSATGQSETMLIEGKGKWLGANCGDVKPVDLKPAPAK